MDLLQNKKQNKKKTRRKKVLRNSNLYLHSLSAKNLSSNLTPQNAVTAKHSPLFLRKCQFLPHLWLLIYRPYGVLVHTKFIWTMTNIGKNANKFLALLFYKSRSWEKIINCLLDKERVENNISSCFPIILPILILKSTNKTRVNWNKPNKLCCIVSSLTLCLGWNNTHYR